MEIKELFPTTRARLRRVVYGSPKLTYLAEPEDVMYDNFPADPVLYADLMRFDAVGRALLLELRDYRYKPGWMFDLIQRGQGWQSFSLPAQGPYWVKITAQLPDSRWTPDAAKGQSEKDRPVVPVVSELPVWDPLWLCADEDLERNVRTFEAMLHSMIQVVEDHETDEWFRRGDKLVRDPHAQKEPSKVGPIHNA
jgi:hypothetical protein